MSARTTALGIVDRVLGCDKRTRRATRLMLAATACILLLSLAIALFVSTIGALGTGVLGTSLALLARYHRQR